MRKEYCLPAVASLLIFGLLFSSIAPVGAAIARPKALPVLEITTIAEDDEFRKTGVIVFGLPVPTGWPKPSEPGFDKLAQYKILVTYNGVPVTPNLIVCQVFEKDKIAPGKLKQFYEELVKTVVIDVSDNFFCKPRWGKPGVGVLDVYYLGPQHKEYIADNVMVVYASLKVGRSTIWGTEIQDICTLGWSMADNSNSITKPDGSTHWTWDNPLGPFVSCEEASIWQKVYMDFPIQGEP